mmetsp:Transcript_17408/g.42939  ORF Transcript_17408/g.42939 Transcript_17408/m.42939 type:complete len:512 (-) Transcript_17408:11-1546(-)
MTLISDLMRTSRGHTHTNNRVLFLCSCVLIVVVQLLEVLLVELLALVGQLLCVPCVPLQLFDVLLGQHGVQLPHHALHVLNYSPHDEKEAHGVRPAVGDAKPAGLRLVRVGIGHRQQTLHDLLEHRVRLERGQGVAAHSRPHGAQRAHLQHSHVGEHRKDDPPEHHEPPALERARAVLLLLLLVGGVRLLDALDHAHAVVLHRREVLLHRHADGLVDVLAHLLQRVGNGHGEEVRVVPGQVDGGQLEGVRVLDAAGQVLGDLDQHALPIILLLNLVSLAKIVGHLLGVVLVEALHGDHGALAQRLPDGVEEAQDEVHVVRQPHDALHHIKRVLHLAVHQPGRVDHVHAREVLVLGRGDLREDVVTDALELLQPVDVVVELEGGVALQGLALAPARDEGEAAGLDGDARGLHALPDVPVDERALARAVVTDQHHVHLFARLPALDLEQRVRGDLEQADGPLTVRVQPLLVQLVDALQDAFVGAHAEGVGIVLGCALLVRRSGHGACGGTCLL